jgi:hypothetical protein
MPVDGSGYADLGRESAADAIIEMTEKKMLVLRKPLNSA